MTEQVKNTLKLIFIIIFVLVADIAFGYGISFLITAGIHIAIKIFAIVLFLVLLIPWNVLLGIIIKERLKN